MRQTSLWRVWPRFALKCGAEPSRPFGLIHSGTSDSFGGSDRTFSFMPPALLRPLPPSPR